ncbi:MAG: alpha-amylase family glycosyl hydrolase, partial [Myxococcota bacterium]
MNRRASAVAITLASLSLLGASDVRAEVILQYFETPWTEIEARMPEIAAAGYGAIWLPPPMKGTEGTRDVGFATYDRFDLGDQNQRGTVATRYGTKDELISLVDTAHRFGVRVYFDVIMNHNGNPNTIENPGVSLEMVDLDAWPDTSVFDYHVLPAKQQPTCGGQSDCEFCAFQPAADNQPYWKVVEQQGNGVGLRSGGAEVCVRKSQLRVSSVTFEEALADLSVRDAVAADEIENDPIYQYYVGAGYTHFVRGPDISEWEGFSFQQMLHSLVGLQDFATEQYLNQDAFADGRNAMNGLPLPSFVRNPGQPELYPDTDLPVAEDIREYLNRWIRWLMLETEADGFRLDAVKHVYPSFYASDFTGDSIAFNRVIQDTYDELHGNDDVDDADLVDDAAIFGEHFTGNFWELSPYVDTGMRMLDFPLYFRMAGFKGAAGSMYGSGGDWGGNADIGQLSVRPTGQDIGGFGGLNRFAGVGFAQSHDKCQGHESVDDAVWGSENFSRCFPVNGQPDLIYSYVLLRDADSVVFFDGNNWTNQSFVRAGRPDALGDTFNGGPQRVVVNLVGAARKGARGEQSNRWVGDDSYAFERVVPGYGPASLVILNDRLGGSALFGDGNGSFIVTHFAPGTELVDLTGNAIDWGASITVVDPADKQGSGELAEALSRYRAVNNGQNPPAGYGLVYTNFPGGKIVVYAPEAVREPVVGLLAAGAVVPTTTVITADDKQLPDGVLVSNSTVTMPLLSVGGSWSLNVTHDPAVVPTRVAARLDDTDGLLSGTSLTSTPERYLDGYVALTEGQSSWTLTGLSTAGLATGVHGLRVRFSRDVDGAAAAQHDVVIPLCVGVASDCVPGASSPGLPESPDAGPSPGAGGTPQAAGGDIGAGGAVAAGAVA